MHCTEYVKRLFPRFQEWSGEMFCCTAEIDTVAEHFSRPFSEPGKNSVDGLCILLDLRTTWSWCCWRSSGATCWACPLPASTPSSTASSTRASRRSSSTSSTQSHSASWARRPRPRVSWKSVMIVCCGVGVHFLANRRKLWTDWSFECLRTRNNKWQRYGGGQRCLS